ncbi:MAG: hypothetical protein R3275_11920 [Saprospiraceae bacterium]|nr:hypothetical protein [Saprospiraceae bacterium]
MDQPPSSDRFRDEITLKDVILAVREHALEVNRSRRLLLVFILLGIAFYLYRHIATPVTYTAECTLMINEKEQNIGFSNILGQFGLGDGKEFNLKKIAELAKTRAMTEAVMFQTVPLDKDSVLLANYFISALESVDEWVDDDLFSGPGELKGFQFNSRHPERFERLENRALQNMNRRMNKRLESDIDDMTGILKFKFTSPDEILSYEVLTRLYESLGEYYTSKSIEKQEATYRTIEMKCDSLAGVLSNKEYALASLRDTRRRQWLNVEQTEEDQLYREIKMLSIMYGEALKNKEMAAFSLANVKPFIQAIDQPIYPLQRNQTIWWRNLLLGLIVGTAIGIVVIVMRKIWRDALYS